MKLYLNKLNNLVSGVGQYGVIIWYNPGTILKDIYNTKNTISNFLQQIMGNRVQWLTDRTWETPSMEEVRKAVVT